VDLHCHTSSHLMRGLYTQSAAIDTILMEMDRYEVERAVILATSFPYKGTGLSTSAAVERVKAHTDRFMVFGTLNVHEDLDKQLIALRGYVDAKPRLMRGLKLYPGYQSFIMQKPKYRKIFRFAEYHRIPVMIHGGELHHCCPRGEFKCGTWCPLDNSAQMSHPDSMVDVFERFPEVRFIVSHLANPYFNELFSIMDRCENVWTDISGQWVTGKEDTPVYKKYIKGILTKFINAGMVDRICFGTDFPIQSHRDSIEIVESMNLSEADQKKVFYLNASKLLGIWRTEWEAEAQRLAEEVFPKELLDL
jgi:predicted TIM-barrel fold metal-dependent hydrolase